VSARVAAGRYVIEVGCRSPAARRYRLTITAPNRPSGDTASSGG
jgi:hypothetical protein